MKSQISNLKPAAAPASTLPSAIRHLPSAPFKSQISDLKSDGAPLLLRQFEALADTPGALPKLRALILDLAVRGKLAPQDCNDEPVSELLKHIRAAREAKAGSIKKQAPPPNLSSGEVFPIPATWTWVPLSALANIVLGQSPPGESYNESGEGVPLINGPVEFTAGPFGKTKVNQYTTDPTNFCEEGDLLLCVRGSTTGRTNTAAFRACIGRGVAAIQPLFPDTYVRFCIWRLRESIISMGRGVAFPSVSRQQIEELPIPLPPLSEQRRIVAKVEELLALCDELEARQTTAREHRTRLVRSALDRLTAAKDEQDLRTRASFVLHKSPFALEVPALRQAVLELAVQGRLVRQDPHEGNAETLLERIRGAKGKAHEMCKSLQCETELSKHTPLHPLPGSWTWARFDRVATISSNLVSPDEFPDSPHVAPDNIEKATGRLLGYRTVREDEVRSGNHRFFSGQVIYSKIRPNLSKATIVGFDGLCSADMYPITSHIHPYYLLTYILSPVFLGMAVRNDTRVAMPKINQQELNQILVAVPPLAEQKRIVAKVEELLRWCDQLEIHLATAQTAGTHLLDACLNQILLHEQTAHKPNVLTPQP